MNTIINQYINIIIFYFNIISIIIIHEAIYIFIVEVNHLIVIRCIWSRGNRHIDLLYNKQMAYYSK